MDDETKKKTWPRLYISDKIHARVKKAAKKQDVPMRKLGDKIALAGLKALGL